MNLHYKFIDNVVICSENKKINLDILNYLASGRFYYFCECQYKHVNKHHYFTYKIDDSIKLSNIKKYIQFNDVIKILESALEIIHDAVDKKIFLSNIKLSKEYIYKTTEGFKFIYLPIYNDKYISAKEFLLKLISIISFKDMRIIQISKNIKKCKNDIQLIQEMLSFIKTTNQDLNSNCIFNDESETTVLNTNLNDSETTILDTSHIESETTLLGEKFDICETTLLESDNGKNYDLPEDSSYEDDITVFCSDNLSENETTILTSNPVNLNELSLNIIDHQDSINIIRNTTGENIAVDVVPFTIGKDILNMDYVINNESVSRHHATIIFENKKYYIIDNNSTNGTMIEGVKLQPNEKAVLENGAILTLGSESFQVVVQKG